MQEKYDFYQMIYEQGVKEYEARKNEKKTDSENERRI